MHQHYSRLPFHAAGSASCLQPAAAKRAKTAPSRGGSKKRRAAAAVVADKQDEEEQQEEDDEDDRDNVDWEAHPAEDIIAHTRTKVQGQGGGQGLLEPPGQGVERAVLQAGPTAWRGDGGSRVRELQPPACRPPLPCRVVLQ